MTPGSPSTVLLLVAEIVQERWARMKTQHLIKYTDMMRESDATRLPKTDLGPYRLEGFLGKGGMGTVFIARDERLGRRVAVKHTPPQALGGSTRLRRFQREAETLARLSHPAIVQIFDVVENAEGNWIIMELIEGPTVAELVAKGPLDIGELVAIARQTVEGLAEAHAQGILHRDLKTENVILQRPTDGATERPAFGLGADTFADDTSADRASAGRASADRASASHASAGRTSAGHTSAGRASADRVKILDFGLAKALHDEGDAALTAGGEVLGTYRAMSPEQASGLPLTPSSDLFAFGVFLYEMATSKRPFDAPSPVLVLHQIVSYPHVPVRTHRPEIPADLAKLIDRLLEKSPELRPASAREVAATLAELEAKLARYSDETASPDADPVVTTGFELAAAPTLAEPSRARKADAASSYVPWRPPDHGFRPVWLVLVFFTVLASLVAGWEIWAKRSVSDPLPARPSAEDVADEPDDYTRFQQGMAYLARFDKPGHLDKAVAAFEAILAHDERSAPAQAGLAMARRWQFATDRDRLHLEQALAAAERAVQLDEHLALARIALGTVYAEARRYDEALRELAVALQLAPTNAEAFRGLGMVHDHQGKIAEATAAYETAVEHEPADQSLRDELGWLYYRVGRYQDAEAQFLKSIELAPDGVYGHRNLSAVYYMQGRLPEAAEALQKALLIKPGHSLYSNLGTIFFAQGLYQQAAQAFEKALSHSGGNQYIYWANLADTYRLMDGHGEQARASYGEAIRLLRPKLEAQPTSHAYQSRLALYLAKSGDCGDALALLATVAELEIDEQAETLYRVAVAYEACGEHQGTETDLGGAGSIRAPDPRQPGLTVLWHPDLTRVGERATLLELATGGEASISRREPGFAAPWRADATAERRALDHASLSRRPLHLRRADGEGTLYLDATGSRTAIVADGDPVVGGRVFSAAEIERGVVLQLGHHVALLLHQLNPLSIPGLPDFGLIGESAAMVRLRLEIRKVADLDVAVLLRGETGSGKELVARAVHQASRRRGGPFLAVNMAAIPASLAAVELFGAVRGAFTGADRRRQGLFVQADSGSLFLDEIGETPLEIQALLLRALETGEIRPVGTEETRKVDVRVISATDADLEAGIAAERFRAPLLHRLSGFELRLPPLRERRDDFGRLFKHFLCQELETAGERHRLDTRSSTAWLPVEIVTRLASYTWPGNVRQLLNVTRQIVITSRGEERARLPETVEMLLAAARHAAAESVPPPAPGQNRAGLSRRLPTPLDDDELVELLRTHRFNLRAAAAAMGISRTYLYTLIEKSPRLRKPAEIDHSELVASLERAGGNVDVAAAELEVSSLGLKRRLKELGLR